MRWLSGVQGKIQGDYSVMENDEKRSPSSHAIEMSEAVFPGLDIGGTVIHLIRLGGRRAAGNDCLQSRCSAAARDGCTLSGSVLA
jgi:hypothetical protein